MKNNLFKISALIGLILPLHVLAQTLILPNSNEQFITSAGIVVDDKGTNNGTVQKTIKFGTTFSGEAIGSKRTSGINQNGLDFYTNGINRLAIANNGNIGIGTTSPSTKLEILNGGLSLSNTGDSKKWEFNYDDINNYFYLDEFGSGRRFLIKNGGNIGFNSLNPQNTLHIHQPLAGQNFIQLTNLATGFTNSISGLRIGLDDLGNTIFWNNANKNMHFNVNSEFNMTIANTSGFVGIGTETPPTKLSLQNGNFSIINTADNKRWELAYDQTDNYLYIDEFGSGRRMVFKNGGNVGIGTTNPTFPFEINGTLTTSAIASEYDYNQITNNPVNGSFITNYSMKANEAILARKFNAFSDQRHKRFIGYEDSKKALETINHLRPTNFKYIDSIALGRETNLGFMAQEVEKIIPEAVSKVKSEYIPNIFMMAKELILLQENTLRIKLAKPHELKFGDELKLLAKQENHSKVSKIIDDYTFEIEKWTDETKQVFVFGKKVDDFRTVDYDRIFTLGISAIQELSQQLSHVQKLLDKEREKNDAQERKLGVLESKINEISNHLKQ